MTSPATPRIDDAVAAMGVGEGTAQAVLIQRHDGDMNVVGRQVIRPDLRARSRRRVGRQVEVELVVAILEEQLLAAIAALRNAECRMPGMTMRGSLAIASG